MTRLLVDDEAVEPEQMYRVKRGAITIASMLDTLAEDLETASESEHATHGDHAIHADDARAMRDHIGDIAEQYGQRLIDHPAHEDKSDRLPQVTIGAEPATSIDVNTFGDSDADEDNDADADAADPEDVALSIRKRSAFPGNSWVAELTGSSLNDGVERRWLTPKGGERATARVPVGAIVEAGWSGGDRAHAYYRVHADRLEELDYGEAMGEATSKEDSS